MTKEELKSLHDKSKKDGCLDWYDVSGLIAALEEAWSELEGYKEREKRDLNISLMTGDRF